MSKKITIGCFVGLPDGWHVNGQARELRHAQIIEISGPWLSVRFSDNVKMTIHTGSVRCIYD